MNLKDIETISKLLAVVSNPQTRTREAMHEIITLADAATAAELSLATHQHLVSLLHIEKAETERELAIAKGEIGELH